MCKWCCRIKNEFWNYDEFRLVSYFLMFYRGRGRRGRFWCYELSWSWKENELPKSGYSVFKNGINKTKQTVFWLSTFTIENLKSRCWPSSSSTSTSTSAQHIVAVMACHHQHEHHRSRQSRGCSKHSKINICIT